MKRQLPMERFIHTAVKAVGPQKKRGVKGPALPEDSSTDSVHAVPGAECGVPAAWVEGQQRMMPRDWDFLAAGREVTARMRAVLLDWLFEVCVEYLLSQKTLQLAALCVDRYLSLEPSVTKASLQLLGLAALSVASKFEDLRPVDVAALVWISDEAYSAAQVVEAEQKLLHTLDWDVAAVPSVSFVDQLVHDLQLEQQTALHLLHFSHFLSHLAVQCWNTSCGVLPHQQACVVVYYAGGTLGLWRQWPDTMRMSPLCCEREDSVIDKCLNELHTLFKGLSSMDLHRALRSKYTHFSLMQVALTPPLKKFEL